MSHSVGNQVYIHTRIYVDIFYFIIKNTFKKYKYFTFSTCWTVVCLNVPLTYPIVSDPELLLLLWKILKLSTFLYKLSFTKKWKMFQSHLSWCFSPILAFFNQNHYAGRSIMGLLFCFTRTVTLILTVRPILLYSLDSRLIPISIPCIRNNMSIECRILGIFSRAGVDPCNSSYITVSHSALNFCDCSNYVEKCEYIWDGRAFKIQVSSFL